MQEVQRQVDGEVFLRILHDHLLQHEKELKKLVLPMNPSCVLFLNAKFEDIDAGSKQSQHLRFLSKRKPLSRSEILDLQFYLETLEHLCLESTQKDVLEENIEVTLMDVFKHLKELQIHRCRPRIILDLDLVSQSIEKLSIFRAVSHLSEVLQPDGSTEGEETSADAPQPKRWGKLKELRMPHNYIVSLDESLMLLSAVTMIDLSHNMIERIENLQFCYSLVMLDLSFNRIRSVHSTVHSLGNLRVLILRGNGLSSTLGLEKLLGLERLDLRENNISSLEDVARLSRLPFLEILFLASNPITQKKNYRREVYLHLHKETLILDGRSASSSEREAARSAAFQHADPETVSTHGVFTPPYPQAMQLFGPPPGSSASRSIYVSSTSRNAPPTYISGGVGGSARSPSRLSGLYDMSTSYPGDGGHSAITSAAALNKRRAKAATARKRLAQIDTVEGQEEEEEEDLQQQPHKESSGGYSPDSALVSPGGTVSPLKETIDKLHEGHGASWLLVYNEFKKSKAPQSSTTTAATSSSSSQPESAKKKREKSSKFAPINPPEETAKQTQNTASDTAQPKIEAKKPKPRPQGPFVVSLPIVTADGSSTAFGSRDESRNSSSSSIPSPAASPPTHDYQPSSSPQQSSSVSSSPEHEPPAKEEPVNEQQPTEAPEISRQSEPTSVEPQTHDSPTEPDSAPVTESIPTQQQEPEPKAEIPTEIPALATEPKQLSDSAKPINVSRAAASRFENDDAKEFEKTEEYYAEVQNDKGEWEPRILILTTKYMEEGDTSTGSAVVKHDLKHLVDARNLSEETPAGSEDEQMWLIRIDFRTSGSTTSHHTVCFYKLENETDATRLTASLRDIVSKSSRKIKCMTCNSEFKLQEIDACPACKSAMLIFFDASSNTPAPSSISSMASTITSFFGYPTTPAATSAPTAAIASSPTSSSVIASQKPTITAMKPAWDESEPTVDGNKQLYLRLTFFKKDDNSETLLSYFTCTYLPFGMQASREALCSLMLSNLNLYLLQPKSRRRTMIFSAFYSASDYQDEDELVACVPFGDIKRIVVGPFYQWFRLEVSPQQIYIFITRAHERTHRLLTLLKQTMRDKVGYVEVSNRNQEIIQSINTDCFQGTSQIQLELFFWVFHRVKPGSGNPQFASVSRDGVSVLPRSLIVTSEEMLLCEEDVRFPYPNFAGLVKPKAAHFTVIHRRKISELSSIETDSEQPNFIKLCFDEDGSSSSSSRSTLTDGGNWGLFTQRSLEAKKLSKTLSREWRALFQVPLTLVEADGIANISA